MDRGLFTWPAWGQNDQNETDLVIVRACAAIFFRIGATAMLGAGTALAMRTLGAVVSGESDYSNHKSSYNIDQHWMVKMTVWLSMYTYIYICYMLL